jgi:hypothetical protein
LIALSFTNQIGFLTIHKILPTVSIVSSIECILFGSFGILGAGGNTGSSNLTVGIKDGISGNFGGAGIIGIAGMDGDTPKPRSSISLPIKSIPISKASSISSDISTLGGSGKPGNLGKGTETGTKLNFGRVISIHKFNLEKSRNMLGILNGGISRIGKLAIPHKVHILQLN